MSKYTLEQHRFFPIVAWSLCISFAFFVYCLCLELQTATAELNSYTETTETQNALLSTTTSNTIP